MIKKGVARDQRLFFLFVLILVSISAASCQHNPPRLAICDLQGTGLISPLQDQEVIISGLVIADLEAIEGGGYLIVDENCPREGESSRGIFFSLLAGKVDLDLGDRIQVRGIVREIEGETRLEGYPQGLEILSLDNPLPEPVDLGLSLRPPLSFGYEKWEGQLVAIPQADLVAGSTRSNRTQVIPHIPVDPPLQAVCFQEDTFILEIDENLLTSSLAVDQFPSRVNNLVGVIRQDQEGYYLQLIEQPTFQKTQPGMMINQEPSGTPVMVSTPTFTNPPPASSTPTVTPVPSSSPVPTVKPTIIPSPTYYPVKLQITEILPDPIGEEPEGEWIEIYNPGQERVPLVGIKIGDALSPASKEGMLSFPEGAFIQGGQVVVIANQAKAYQSSYQFLPDFEIVNSDSRVPDLIPYHRWGGSSIKLSNSGDEVLLVDPWDQVVDLVVYGSSPSLSAPKEGYSLEWFLTDEGGEWRESAFPSPGRLVLSQPTPTATPAASPSPSLTSGFTPTDLTPTISSATPPILPSPSSFPTASITPAPTCPSSTPAPLPSETRMSTPTLTRTVSPAPSITPTSTLIDKATRTSTPTVEGILSPTWTVSASPTLEVTPTSTLTSGSVTETPLLTGTPTPTAPATPTVPSGPILVINEILADPDPVLGDSNRDGVISSDDDEFLELVNRSQQVLDLSGWRVQDAIRLRYTIPEGTYLSPGCGLVIFGGGDPEGDFGGSLVFTAGSLGLNNGGDLITVTDSAGVEMALVEYGSEGNQDQSLTRDPDLYGPLPLVLHGKVPEASGALFSPGTRVDLTAFGGCP